MLTTWNGEFLVNPVPLELSMGACSHGCAYCFSRANCYDGKNWTGGQRFAAKMDRIFRGETENTAAKLIRAGYPVNLSNRSDPFASSNKKDVQIVLSALQKYNVPLHISTKGGPFAEQSIGLVGPSVWYISLSFQDDELRKKFEPGAPSVEERLSLIEAVVKSGSRVIVGANPLVEEWIGDISVFIQKMKDLGVSGIYYQPYHTNPRQWAGMTPVDQSKMQPLREVAQKRNLDKKVFLFMEKFRQKAIEIGVETFCHGQRHTSKMWDCMDVYPIKFGNQQAFVNWCHENKKDNEEVTFSEWMSVIGNGFPEGLFELDRQIHSVVRNLDIKVPRFMTYVDLCKFIWKNCKHTHCPANMECFSYLAEVKTDGLYFVRDSEDMPKILFRKGVFGSYYVSKGGEKIEV